MVEVGVIGLALYVQVLNLLFSANMLGVWVARRWSGRLYDQRGASGKLFLESRWIPKLFGQSAVEHLPGLHVGLLELRVRFEWQGAFLNEFEEAGIVLVRQFMKTLGQEILL
jgi:hypothetical protein